ncbi:hypothetical protein SISNIDRAFT_465587 [Sistotremastrum niveocremeum HHB9708]|uniref:Uncharacterized protein n=1 Tax=Sistotremastrum niveocremeum HHB9708 TaxID=1314777 RepID=A0A164VC46_9AGAM|nr:hypothetical protein SISNIDRAFT_465587 [Sistotremastrum niveocremeum HHB9708]
MDILVNIIGEALDRGAQGGAYRRAELAKVVPPSVDEGIKIFWRGSSPHELIPGVFEVLSTRNIGEVWVLAQMHLRARCVVSAAESSISADLMVLSHRRAGWDEIGIRGDHRDSRALAKSELEAHLAGWAAHAPPRDPMVGVVEMGGDPVVDRELASADSARHGRRLIAGKWISEMRPYAWYTFIALIKGWCDNSLSDLASYASASEQTILAAYDCADILCLWGFFFFGLDVCLKSSASRRVPEVVCLKTCAASGLFISSGGSLCWLHRGRGPEVAHAQHHGECDGDRYIVNLANNWPMSRRRWTAEQYPCPFLGLTGRLASSCITAVSCVIEFPPLGPRRRGCIVLLHAHVDVRSELRHWVLLGAHLGGIDGPTTPIWTLRCLGGTFVKPGGGRGLWLDLGMLFDLMREGGWHCRVESGLPSGRMTVLARSRISDWVTSLLVMDA